MTHSKLLATFLNLAKTKDDGYLSRLMVGLPNDVLFELYLDLETAGDSEEAKALDLYSRIELTCRHFIPKKTPDGARKIFLIEGAHLRPYETGTGRDVSCI